MSLAVFLLGLIVAVVISFFFGFKYGVEWTAEEIKTKYFVLRKPL